jgi:hypothetical protein
MSESPVDVLLCDFDPLIGWRVRAVSKSDSKRVDIFKFGSIKLLRIPVIRVVKPGRFCNPKTCVLEFVRSTK